MVLSYRKKGTYIPDTNYVLNMKQVNGKVRYSIFRNPATVTLTDSTTTATAPNHIGVSQVMDQGFGSPASTTISNASNASPIVLTVASVTGFNNGDMCYISNVGGNTNANGTFFISSVSGTSISLDGSSGNAAYTSGGNIVQINPALSYQMALAAAMRDILNDKAAGN